MQRDLVQRLLPRLEGARTVAAYVATGNEIDPLGILLREGAGTRAGIDHHRQGAAVHQGVHEEVAVAPGLERDAGNRSVGNRRGGYGRGRCGRIRAHPLTQLLESRRRQEADRADD